MKRASILFSILVASSVCGFCADKAPVKAAKNHPANTVKARKHAPNTGSEPVALTGSYIKRDIHRKGSMIDGPNLVVVLDSDMIRNSGAVDIRQLLGLRGITR